MWLFRTKPKYLQFLQTAITLVNISSERVVAIPC